MFQETVAASMWQQYQTLTSALSQQLCEQLRLILEPTQAAKLKSVKHTGNLDSLCCGETGPLLMWADAVCVCINCIFVSLYVRVLRGDYRTGKRLNMRKVIPYIASQFRKDKIWLRRTKPSKREYQICLAVDDSSSMVDNHSKQVRGSSYNQKRSVIVTVYLVLIINWWFFMCHFPIMPNFCFPYLI